MYIVIKIIHIVYITVKIVIHPNKIATVTLAEVW